MRGVRRGSFIILEVQPLLIQLPLHLRPRPSLSIVYLEGILKNVHQKATEIRWGSTSHS
jgi:hypothetical protein